MSSRIVVRIVAVFALLAVGGCAATPGKVSVKDPVPVINSENGVAVKGYDPVAYFTTGSPQKGSDDFTFPWRGVTWKFVSAENRAAFIQAPEHYAPQYGGYCSFAVSRGTIADIDPGSWAVVGDRLYLNNNPFAHQLWSEDRPGNIAAADQNWPLIPKHDAATR